MPFLVTAYIGLGYECHDFCTRNGQGCENHGCGCHAYPVDKGLVLNGLSNTVNLELIAQPKTISVSGRVSTKAASCHAVSSTDGNYSKMYALSLCWSKAGCYSIITVVRCLPLSLHLISHFLSFCPVLKIWVCWVVWCDPVKHFPVW